MKKRNFIRSIIPAALILPHKVLYAETYLTPEQAAAQMWPKKKLTAQTITLSEDQMKAIQKLSGVRVRNLTLQAWKVEGGGWLLIDNVIGKHEFIDYALAINADGSVKNVEILTYRETYGGEVRHAKWRAQFSGKTSASDLKVDTDIKNISGATLSSVSVTQGVKRLLHTWSLVLKDI
jgi:Na+-translocating ferredoxin:NAD+ oxidoreductase RnfG subunit